MADVRLVIDSDGKALWWLGQSGFLVVQNGGAILLDPYLSDSLTNKYAKTDKPHVRITNLVVRPFYLAALGIVDIITSSHNHTDHFDPATLIPILTNHPNPILILPAP